ncbi:MAG: hypothetical protein SFX73_30150 [Kofleriaceae bacterium]|nr:hypothetical protein [Kofleriaceae bacterium]
MEDALDAAPQTDASSPDARDPAAACSIKTGHAGIVSVLHDPDGAVRATVQTGANGLASWDDCPANALVSYAKYSADDGWKGVTVAGLQPGDHVEVMRESSDLVTTGKVAIPNDAADVVMIRAWAGGVCSANTGEGATASISVTENCRGEDGTKLPVLAIGNIGGVAVYAHSLGASIVAGGDTPVTDMSGWMTGPQLSVSATNVFSNQMQFEVQPMWNGRSYGGLSQLVNASDNAASANLSLPPSAFSGVRRVGVSTSGLARRGIVRTTTAYDAMFDMGFLLPEISALTVDETTAGRPAYAVVGALTSTDLGIIHTGWMNNGVAVSWRLIYPSATTSTITFPALPEDLAGATPTSAMTSYAAAVDVTGSTYAQVLARGYRFGEFMNSCPEVPAGSECWFSTRSFP